MRAAAQYFLPYRIFIDRKGNKSNNYNIILLFNINQSIAYVSIFFVSLSEIISVIRRHRCIL